MTPLLLLAVLGCTPKEDALPALSATPDAVDLGTVAIGEIAEATVVLRNDGGGAVEILSASLVEGDARAWSVARAGFDALTGDVTTTLTVTFSPDDEGASPAELQVRSTDPEQPSLYVALTGIGGPSTADDDGDGYSPAAGDCDDRDAAIFPGADEVCDGEDSDCDGETPADEVDADGDGWRLCDADCDDADRAVYPGAPEICDDKDSDCDGATPDRDDADGDGFSICDADCDDAEPAAFPGAVEVCDEVDNDCSGAADDLDADGDGASLCGALPDCDDADPAAFPVFVDAAAEPGGGGTELSPYATIAEGLAGLDATCRTLGLFAGAYAESLAWSADTVTIVGLGAPEETTITPPEGERAFNVTGGALTLERLTLAGATNASGDGGAVRASGADVTLRNVVATGNTTAADGGAVAVSSGTLTLDACTFSDNTAGDDGGAVALVSATLHDAGTAYVGNAAIQGGAIFGTVTTVDLDGSTFADNVATDDGGAVAFESVSGTMDRLVFIANIASDRGGAMVLNEPWDLDGWIRNTRFLGNAATVGGGVAVTGSFAGMVLANNTFVGNVVTGEGAALHLDAGESNLLYVYANVLAWNDGDSGLWARADGFPTLAYNLGYATSSGVDFSLPEGLDNAEALVADPLFSDFSDDGDPTDDDLTLRAGSPARDSGPAEGAGPSFYDAEWLDVDGTSNDRGYTGGQGGW